MQPFINKSTKVNICGREVQIKALTLKQTICLGSIMGKLYEAFGADTSKDNNFILNMLCSAGPGQAGEIINILTNFCFEREKDISAQITLEETAALAKAVSEVNDFAAVAANFKLAFEGKKI
ncbi:hypothetical protein AAIR98_001606 [Elusimicrobium simillimum]|uniref:hypothetical protein n=1 Tax=Elusimicrobium simillimum TaxID=3143438 RepID=UPI003C6F6917